MYSFDCYTTYRPCGAYFLCAIKNFYVFDNSDLNVPQFLHLSIAKYSSLLTLEYAIRYAYTGNILTT